MKKHFPLIAGIAIPVLLILFVAGSIYLPGLFVKPKYDFLYMSGVVYGQPYFVTNGQLNKTNATSTYAPVYPQGYPQGQPQLYVYGVAQNQSKAISFADAQALSLDPNVQSPDGFLVVSGNYSNDSFPFYYGSNYDYNAHYLTGHNVSRKLNLQLQSDNYYGNNFTFLGWIND